MNKTSIASKPERGSAAAAFFDLDGTLLGGLSLERRFFEALRYRREIGLRNYWAWFCKAGPLLKRGIARSFEENKMYLKGVRAERATERSWLPAPSFSGEGVDVVAWHVRRGHAIVLVSGTLDFLAKHAAELLTARLRGLGLEARLQVCATRLETQEGIWTGSVHGEVVMGREKGFRMQEAADELGVELRNCFAYGNSEWDRWMLAMAGHAVAVNPTKELERIAEHQRWRVVRWHGKQTAVEQAVARKSQEILNLENLR